MNFSGTTTYNGNVVYRPRTQRHIDHARLQKANPRPKNEPVVVENLQRTSVQIKQLTSLNVQLGGAAKNI
jgi:hypothetical protein